MAFVIRPQQPYLAFDILLRPFELDVWLCLLATFLLFFIFDQLKNRLFSPKSSVSIGQQIDSLDNLCWINFCLLYRQPYPWLTRLRLSAKICAISFIFSISVLSNNYGGGLCSLLALPASSSIDNLDKLADACRSNHIIPLALDGGFFQKMKVFNFKLNFFITNKMIKGHKHLFVSGNFSDRSTYKEYGRSHYEDFEK